MSTLTRALPIAETELRLLVRNRAVLFSASLFPLAMAAYLLTLREDTRNAGIALFSMNLAFFTTFSIYATVTTTLVARREDLYLKRLRSGESSDVAIIVGLVAPLVALCVAQLALVLAAMLALGVRMPGNPLPLLLAAVGLIAVTSTVGVLTAVLTPTSSASQISSVPFLLLVVGSLALAPQADSPLMDLTPGGAVVTLVRSAYGASVEGSVLTATLGLAVWAYAGFELARRRFVWEPRA
jgi:ABC-2 type transport system permease protein